MLNYISCPELDICVINDKPTPAYVEFMRLLYYRQLYAYDRIYSYMSQHHIPKLQKNSTKQKAYRQIITLRKEDLIVGRDTPVEDKMWKDVNGWFLMTHASGKEYAGQYLRRVDEAFGGNKIKAVLAYRGRHDYDDAAHLNVTKEEYHAIINTHGE